jgi:HEAT repeat protein
MWWLGFPFLAGGVLVLNILFRNRQFLAGWQNAVTACKLTRLQMTTIWAPRVNLTARTETLHVSFDAGHKGKTWLQVRVPELPGFADVKLRRAMYVLWGGAEIEVGDEPLDQEFFIEGPVQLVTAMLDAEVRRLLLAANAEGEVEIRDGAVCAQVSQAALPRLLPLLLDIGQRLTQNLDIAGRLADNARRDPLPGVRLRNLLVLARERAGEPVTLDALRAACSDSSPEIRLRAAVELGAEGHEVLIALAASTEDDTWSAQAVSALGQHLPFERTKAILDQALRSHRLETARACLASLGRWRAAGVDELVKVLESEQDELAAAAALALGETGEASAEPPLHRALRYGSPDLQIAAATALGRIGSVETVLPLQEAAESGGRDVRQAAHQAIAEIQARLQGAAPGQLSLTADEAGQLSLSEGEAGQLSLAPETAGQLSPRPERPVAVPTKIPM